MNAIRLSHRHGGRYQMNQGRSFILLDRAEALALVADLQQLLESDEAQRADTAMRIGNAI